MSFSFDRERYLEIARNESVEAALTALHRETTRWEIESFEGQKGWQPEMWKRLQAVRDFQRELWEMALRNPTPSKH